MNDTLNKYLARCGIASRRKAVDLIESGRVTINGEIELTPGRRVEPGDVVTYDGLPLDAPDFHYILLNKPKGVLVTMDDPQNRSTILNYLPDVGCVLKPVGRLDKESEGLLICTNDGELAARLTHPRYSVDKEYVVMVDGSMPDKSLGKLEKGVFMDGSKTSPAQVSEVNRRETSTQFHLVIHEGRNRQIRRMCAMVGHEVTSLKRIRIGSLIMRKMPSGMCRILSKSEVNQLRQAVGLK